MSCQPVLLSDRAGGEVQGAVDDASRAPAGRVSLRTDCAAPRTGRRSCCANSRGIQSPCAFRSPSWRCCSCRMLVRVKRRCRLDASRERGLSRAEFESRRHMLRRTSRSRRATGDRTVLQELRAVLVELIPVGDELTLAAWLADFQGLARSCRRLAAARLRARLCASRRTASTSSSLAVDDSRQQLVYLPIFR